ncbi:TonB-dependent receptor [Aquimarina aggregata]|uniref:TonB-dependent receptor n=1 Tax=Aquimarina aggregata TaxID=1642818 RepID=UPI0024913B69|nr:TonB-dependent receptor [Aquimarina aggregata]
MRKILTTIALCCLGITFAQETGTIAGKLLDKEANNQPLPFANVVVQGTAKGASTDFDGLFEIPDVPVGTYTLEFRFTGYQTVEVPNVLVEANKIAVVDATLGASAAELEAVVIKVVTSREREEALLLEQKAAVEIKQAIGAQELARKGVSDAEGAVTKVSGVSKQEGVKNVFVRGLGDRYNATTLNGLPLPSEDPEYKNISLGFFNSDIIQAVGISKNFGATQYGDAGGAIIDIQSKELTGNSIFQISIGTGFNSIVLNEDFLTLDEGKWFGNISNKDIPITSLNSYSFDNSFKPDQQDLQTNTSIGFQFGKRFNIGENRLNVFITGSLDNQYLYREGNARVINAQGGTGRDLDFNKYIYETSQLLMGNFKYSFNAGTISYNTILVHNNTQNIGDFTGFAENISEESDAAFIRRQQQNEDLLFVNQLLSKFNINKKLSLDLGVSYNTTRGNEPDRRTNTYTVNDNIFRPALGSPGLTNRFYSDLEEEDIAARASLNLEFGNIDEDDKFNGVLTIGGNLRQTDREFNFTQFNHDFRQPVVADINTPESLFNQQSIDNDIFTLVTNRGSNNVNADPLAPFFYTGDRTIYAGYITSDIILNQKWSFGLGLRLENVDQFVEFDTNLASSIRDPNVDPSEIEELYVLPSLNAKYSFNENSILRLAASQTYTFPQFKEVAPFLYEDVTFSSSGFPGLEASTNYNLDIKYEYYFSQGELISFTGFFKQIEDPINRIAINSAANNLSYRNTGDNATVAGIELEIRKDLFKNESEDASKSRELSAGLNASYLYSTQELDDQRSQANFTSDDDELEGASPFLLNADVTYNYNKEKFDATSSIVLSYFSDRIYSLGTQGQGNIVEKGIPTLDFITKLKFDDKYGLSIGIKNILNPEYELNQDTVDGRTIAIRTFEKGIIGSLGFTYNF